MTVPHVGEAETQVAALDLRRHVYPTFGDRSLAALRPSEIQVWVRSLEERLALSTIEVVYSFVAGVFRPVAGLRGPPPRGHRRGARPASRHRLGALGSQPN